MWRKTDEDGKQIYPIEVNGVTYSNRKDGGNAIKIALGEKIAQISEGHTVEMYVLKTKVCKWDRKLGTAHLNYTKGIDILRDTIDLATYFGFIDNPVAGTFRILNPDTGDLEVDSEGNEIKIRGKKNLVPYFEEHLDTWKKLYNKVYDKLQVKDDPNVVAFEKMLNIDLVEKLGINLDESEEI